MASRKYKIWLLPAARQDFFEIGAHIAADSRDRAVAHLDKIRSKIGLLERYPKIGVIPKDAHLKEKGYRILIVDSYLVFYVLRKRTVKIRRVLHGSRSLDSILF